jgi:ABC-type transport system involved in Fe-S cluster assembly fused permease/ATPase subunit
MSIYRYSFLCDFCFLAAVAFDEMITQWPNRLDTETERAIQASLAELAVGRTTLVIAHRLATIQNADRIIVVDETGVAEQGRHHDLVLAGGVYQRLHEAQFGTAAGFATPLAARS